MGYTLAQLKAFTSAAAKRERQRSVDLLLMVRAAQYPAAEFRSVLRKLDRDNG
jgi:hypothetical protein